MPEFRNSGYGSALVRELVSHGKRSGFPAIVLCPSDDDLFAYYGSRTDLRDWFYIYERRHKALPPVGNNVGLTQIMPDDYRNLREKLLADVPHIDMGVEAISYQSHLCKQLGGGLFRADLRCGSACATVEVQPDGTVWVKELLAPDNSESGMLSSIAAAFPSAEYKVRTTAQGDLSRAGIRRFGMLAGLPCTASTPTAQTAAPWFGLAFD
jgi:hypothetical protein